MTPAHPGLQGGPVHLDYNGDLAVASLVEGGSSGIGSAGCAVWDLLTAG
ncbi:hypothetical protein AB0I51_21550 [Streptomyces sp. NPDC050549]